MNNGVIAKQLRADIDVRVGRHGGPHISIRLPKEFYGWSEQDQGACFVKAAEIAFDKFGEHLLAMKKAGS